MFQIIPEEQHQMILCMADTPEVTGDKAALGRVNILFVLVSSCLGGCQSLMVRFYWPKVRRRKFNYR